MLDLSLHTQQKTVVVGMSGGVDSSVAALLLKQQGYHVIGMFMKNWDEQSPDGVCQATLDFEDVVRTCEILDIPYYSIDFVQEYWDRVFTYFLQEYALGATPNPDVLCNREIKFQVFLEKALMLGADYLATGHYCQIRPNIQGPSSEFTLIKGKDLQKDQSYFLYTLSSSILEKVLFPIGNLRKDEVRKLARQYGLPTHSKKDSTGICFIGERNFTHFLGQYLKSVPGDFVTLSGQVVGQHQGFAFYTIGQRKGLGLGGAGEAWYVVAKNLSQNVVYVERGATHPSLYSDECYANEVTWISGIQPETLPFACKAKIRYRQEDQDCLIERVEGDLMVITFPRPQRAITPRQSIVFYKDDVCLGGAMIQSAGPSYFEQRRPLPDGITHFDENVSFKQ